MSDNDTSNAQASCGERLKTLTDVVADKEEPAPVPNQVTSSNEKCKKHKDDLCMLHVPKTDLKCLFKTITHLKKKNELLQARMCLSQMEVQIWRKANDVKKTHKYKLMLIQEITKKELREIKEKYFDLLLKNEDYNERK